MGKIEKLMLEHWTERLPVPLEMSADEILAWENEYVEQSCKVKATPETTGGIVLYVEGISPTKADTLSNAVRLAAAKLNEINLN